MDTPETAPISEIGSTSCVDKPRKRGFHRRTQDLSQAVKILTEAGYTPHAIAERLDMSQATVTAVLKDARTKLQDAQGMAADAWVQAVSVAAKKGRHEPARDLLLHSGAIEPIAGQQGQGVQVVIGVALPGLPSEGAKPAPILVQSTTPVLLSPCESTTSSDVVG